MENEDYDLIIIGAGPAGLTASIYASRYKLNHLIFGAVPGGLVNDAHKICNFPSEIEITGSELSEKMRQSALAQSGNNNLIIPENIKQITKEKNFFRIVSYNKEEYFSSAILLASGTERIALNIENENEFLGKGVSYCATCDGMFFKDKTVAVVGGGNSALTASLYLSEIAEKIYHIYRGDELKGDTAWREKVLSNSKIEIIYNRTIKKLEGENKLERIILDQEYDSQEKLDVDGVFIEIGTRPNIQIFKDLGVEVNQKGYIVVNSDQSTNVDGVWAAGDITTGSNSFRQIITACAEGAVAVNSIFSNL